MSIFNYLRSRRKKSAKVAKERLQIILAHERVDANGPDYLPILKKEIIEVIAKYVKVDLENVKVKLDKNGDYEVLELNVVLSDEPVDLAPAEQRA